MELDVIKNEHVKYLNVLSWERAIKILSELCEDAELACRIISMARTSISDVDLTEIASKVFAGLNAIQVEDLWDNSGKTRWGYQEPTEVAFEMIEDEISSYIQEMEQLRELKMNDEEMIYCKGILSGLIRYGSEGSNDFHDWVPDDPYTVAENIIYEWKSTHTAEERDEIQAFYDSLFDDSEVD
jgi:hypothetical protein